MSAGIQRIPFDETLRSHAKVAAFDCGPQPWEKQIGDWLRSDDPSESAVACVRRNENVWLYVNDSGDLVGMGSLGIGRLAWPKPSSKLVAASSIPMLGVDAKYQGSGFGGKILSDLVATALLEAHIRPQLVLYVHESNVRALDFCRKHNFIEHGKPWLDRSTGWLNKRMVLDFGSVTTG